MLTEVCKKWSLTESALLQVALFDYAFQGEETTLEAGWKRFEAALNALHENLPAIQKVLDSYLGSKVIQQDRGSKYRVLSALISQASLDKTIKLNVEFVPATGLSRYFALSE
jgi:hypothetical protein